MQAHSPDSTDAPRVHVEVGFLPFELGLEPAAADRRIERADVPAAAAVERQHAAEQFHYDVQAFVAMLTQHATFPFAAERQQFARSEERRVGKECRL